MQTKQISQQSAAGVEALAMRAADIENRLQYEKTKQKVAEYLEIAEDLKSDFRKLQVATELRSLLGDLGLDGEYSAELDSLEDNIKNLQQALDKIWMNLYDMKKGV